MSIQANKPHQRRRLTWIDVQCIAWTVLVIAVLVYFTIGSMIR